MLRIRIRDQGSGAFLTPEFGIWDPGPGSGIGEKSGSRSGIRIWDGKPDHQLRNHFFWLKYLTSLMRIQNPGWKKFRSGIRDPGWKNFDPGSGIQDGKNSDPGSRIWDKHPRSAKLVILLPNLLGLKEPNNNLTLCEKGILG